MSTDNQARPGDRFGNAFTPGKQNEFREARSRPIELEKLPEAKPQVAEQMKLQPEGLQKGPSGPGQNYVNPMAFKRSAVEQASSATPEKPRLSLFEAAQQRLKEARADNTLSRENLQAPRPILRMSRELERER